MRDSLSEMKSLVSVLEGIETADDAKAAKSKIEKIAKRMKAIKTRMDKLGDPDAELEKKLKEKYESQMLEIMPKMMKAMMGMKPEVAQELGSAMKDMPKM